MLDYEADIILLDTECTGMDANDRLCQVAYKADGELRSSLFFPPVPISLGAMAVHHITQKMVDGREEFIGSAMYDELKARFDAGAIFVAHNAPFDLAMLKREGIEPKNIICTLKVSRHLDKGAVIPQHTLQFLRYYHGLELDAVAHDAEGDVKVLEGVFDRLIELMIDDASFPQVVDKQTAYAEMMAVTMNPSLVKIMPFGKYAGRKLEELAMVDRGYLMWLRDQKRREPVPDADWMHTLDHYLKKPV